MQSLVGKRCICFHDKPRTFELMRKALDEWLDNRKKTQYFHFTGIVRHHVLIGNVLSIERDDGHTGGGLPYNGVNTWHVRLDHNFSRTSSSTEGYIYFECDEGYLLGRYVK